MIISALLMSATSYKSNISNSKIEEKAIGLGMHFNDECKVILKGDE